MHTAASFLGVDLGASSGRVIAGHWDGSLLRLDELHRFKNLPVSVGDRITWNVSDLNTAMLDGFRRFKTLYNHNPDSIGIDGWGIDFGLLDKQGQLISNPVHYRDRRTEGIPEKLFERLSEDSIFRETGVQSWRINTLFQLYSMVLEKDPILSCAESFLTIPDLFSFFLTGTIAIEFTEATTTQMFSLHRGDWARDILRLAGIPERVLPTVVPTCSRLGPIRPSIREQAGFSHDVPVIAVAAHDTASAVAAIPHLDDRSMFISSGTWSLVGAELNAPNLSERAFQQGFTNEGSIDGKFLLLKNLAGLWMFEECIRAWEREGNCFSCEEVMQAAAEAPRHRTFLDPNDDLFQMPRDMPAAVFEYCRRTRQSPPESTGGIARSIFEGLALSYRMAQASIEDLLGWPILTIRIVGGGSQNSLLSQMAADACNCLVVTGPTESTALGNILAQAIATGHIMNFGEGRIAIADSFLCKTYEPRHSEEWVEAFARSMVLRAQGDLVPHETHVPK
ncbi:MAG TPA: rhamnulokinase family protein [Terracidiphilus sp.]|jgi:sugar (pentulose or hexulose) kinase